MVLTDKPPITPMNTNVGDGNQVVQEDPIGCNGAKGGANLDDKENNNNKKFLKSWPNIW